MNEACIEKTRACIPQEPDQGPKHSARALATVCCENVVNFAPAKNEVFTAAVKNKCVAVAAIRG